jgi:hypothetical protein
MSWLDRRLPYLSSTMAWMVGLGLLTTPVGPTEVMMIVRLEPPRPPGLLLPGLLRLLIALSTSPQRCQCSSRSWSLVNSTAPLQGRSSNRKRKGGAEVAWFHLTPFISLS